MTTDSEKNKGSKKVVKPAPPHERHDDHTHVHPDQDRHEAEQDHHEHGNLPKRPGRPGTT